MFSSTLPSRRPGASKTNRPGHAKDTENANAARAPRSKSSVSITGQSRVTAPTAASRAKAKDAALNGTGTTADTKEGGKPDLAGSVKRKREALGELAVVGVNKQKLTGVGPSIKGGKDGVVLAKPARMTMGTHARTASMGAGLKKKQVLEQVEEVVQEVAALKSEGAMQVDDHPVQPHPQPQQVQQQPSHPRLPALTPKLSASRAAALRQQRRFNSRQAAAAAANADEAEALRVHKKRRTSSDVPDHHVEDHEEHHHVDDSEARIAEELQAFADAEEAEADPNGSQWHDIDAEDADDPTMVSEYVVDIFGYLKGIEHLSMPSPVYMESQRELSWKMRGILTDWLIQVHVRFRLLPETLFLAVNIIDRFLSARVVSLAKLQLVGITCMFIAAKVEEVIAPSVSHFLMCADASYTEDEILKAERYVLKIIEWDMSYPNPMHYLRRISKADDFDIKVRTLGKYLLEITCLEWRLLATPPSLSAAAAIWLARLALGRGDWTPNLAHYSSYPESALIPTAKLMLDYILKPIRHESFFKKYAGKRYYKSSLYMREWALERWSEGASINLQRELAVLKAQSRKQREAYDAMAAQEALRAAEEQPAPEREGQGEEA